MFAVLEPIASQELNASVEINYDQIPGSNRQVFKTLENAINEYMNQTKWTNFDYKTQERITCNFTITISEYINDNFKGNIQIQSSRPVFNSTYETPVFNFRDDNFSFNYKEFEPLRYNENAFESNLVSMLNFYAYLILGMDADSFGLNAGTAHYENAMNVAIVAQQGNYSGWSQNDGRQTRFILIDNVLSPTYSKVRISNYKYHRLGMDKMSENPKAAKEVIADAIMGLRAVFDSRPNAYLVRVFMDSKSDEIVQIFSEGPNYNTSKLKEDLLRISPVNSEKWNNIR